MSKWKPPRSRFLTKQDLIDPKKPAGKSSMVGGTPEKAGGGKEAINTPFRPLQEKFHTFVLRGLRNISEAPQNPPMNFLLPIYVWPIFRLPRLGRVAQRRARGGRGAG